MAINRSLILFRVSSFIAGLRKPNDLYLILSGYSASSRVRLRRFNRGGFTLSVLKRVIFIQHHLR